MVHTKGTIMLRTANQYNRRVWSWDELTEEGASLSRELWENIPADRLMLAARDSLRYTLLHGSMLRVCAFSARYCHRMHQEPPAKQKTLVLLLAGS